MVAGVLRQPPRIVLSFQLFDLALNGVFDDKRGPTYAITVANPTLMTMDVFHTTIVPMITGVCLY